MSVKDHYDKHLGHFYAWMTGDLAGRQKEFEQFLRANGIAPSSSGIALDLGAGHGIQAIPLARAGFRVTAIDFSEKLLDELRSNSGGHEIRVVLEDIRNVKSYSTPGPELVVCCGDTLAHLGSREEMARFLRDTCEVVVPGGKLVLSFRDYSKEQTGAYRFIPVKSDDRRILTCILEYGEDSVRVTDLLYEKAGDVWEQKISSYHKIRVSVKEVAGILASGGVIVSYTEEVNGMVTMIAAKPPR
jgi:SAM-dependent methyltransferase